MLRWKSSWSVIIGYFWPNMINGKKWNNERTRESGERREGKKKLENEEMSCHIINRQQKDEAEGIYPRCKIFHTAQWVFQPSQVPEPIIARCSPLPIAELNVNIHTIAYYSTPTYPALLILAWMCSGSLPSTHVYTKLISGHNSGSLGSVGLSLPFKSKSVQLLQVKNRKRESREKRKMREN